MRVKQVKETLALSEHQTKMLRKEMDYIIHVDIFI